MFFITECKTEVVLAKSCGVITINSDSDDNVGCAKNIAENNDETQNKSTEEKCDYSEPSSKS